MNKEYTEHKFANEQQFQKLAGWLYSRLSTHYWHTTYNNGIYAVCIRKDADWFAIPQELLAF